VYFYNVYFFRACIGLGASGVIHTLISDALWREKGE
jgi:hypothetical protein